MGEKINNILKGEIISSVFYVLLGLCLILIPTQTVDVICKVVFGLILIGVGIYHIYIYILGKGFCHDHGSFKWRGCFCTRCIPFYDTVDRDQTASMDAGSFCTCGQSLEIQGSISSEKRRTEILECAADRKPDLYCAWNRDPVRKISEDHDFTDLFRMGAGL